MKLKPNKWHRFQFDRGKPDELYPLNIVEQHRMGLYAIFVDNICTYIGCSRNVFSRLKEHLKYAYIFTPRTSKIKIAVKLLTGRYIVLPTEIEKKLIKKIKPPGNFKTGPSTDLVKTGQFVGFHADKLTVTKLDDLARERGMSRGALLRLIIREFIERHR